jgi:hypothetical protein
MWSSTSDLAISIRWHSKHHGLLCVEIRIDEYHDAPPRGDELTSSFKTNLPVRVELVESGSSYRSLFVQHVSTIGR